MGDVFDSAVRQGAQACASDPLTALFLEIRRKIQHCNDVLYRHFCDHLDELAVDFDGCKILVTNAKSQDGYPQLEISASRECGPEFLYTYAYHKTPGEKDYDGSKHRNVDAVMRYAGLSVISMLKDPRSRAFMSEHFSARGRYESALSLLNLT